MPLAARSVAKLEGQHEDGPATRASSTRLAARRQSRLAWQQQRTFEDIVGAPRLARLLEVVEELRRPVSCTDARPQHALACRTELRAHSQM